VARKKQQKKKFEKKSSQEETTGGYKSEESHQATSPPDFTRERKVWIGVAVVLFAVSVVLFVYAVQAGREVGNYDANLVNCSMELEEAGRKVEERDAQLGGLKRELDASRLGKVGESGLPDKYIEEFKRKGLENPVQDIATDLMGHSDLIPHEGTWGRPMRFHNIEEIYVLGPNRVFANFGDGREYGWMLLDYRVSNNGEIIWKVTESYCPYYDK
jgi:hypothetical protein